MLFARAFRTHPGGVSYRRVDHLPIVDLDASIASAAKPSSIKAQSKAEPTPAHAPHPITVHANLSSSLVRNAKNRMEKMRYAIALTNIALTIRLLNFTLAAIFA
jgi:hypothetical protein